MRTFEITPEDVGLARAAPEALRGGDAGGNAKALKSVLEANAGPCRDVCVLNAAAALVVAGRASNIEHGVALATKSVESGAAADRLKRLIAVSNA